MYGNIHLGENETYKPKDHCTFLCMYLYIYINKTTVKPFFIKTETRQNVYNLTF